jgi:SAM-dependent methyltransferase
LTTPLTAKKGGYPSEALTTLAGIEAGHFWFENRNRLVEWAVQRYFPGARSLLEVGCGTGFVLAALRAVRPGLALTGTDLLPQALTIARERAPDAHLLAQDARELDAVEAFDVVAACDLLEHVPEDSLVLDRLHAVAVPGGGLIVTVPQHPRLWSATDEYAGHVRRYRRRELVARVEAAGFDLLLVTSFVALPLPLMLLSRLLLSPPATGPHHAELTPPAAVNRLLHGLLGVERLAIRLGVSWPAGGSLLAVARKRCAARGSS